MLRRDEVLANSAVGRKLIEVYYNNDERIMEIPDKYPTTRKIAKKLLVSIIPAIELLLMNPGFVVDREVIADRA